MPGAGPGTASRGSNLPAPRFRKATTDSYSWAIRAMKSGLPSRSRSITGTWIVPCLLSIVLRTNSGEPSAPGRCSSRRISPARCHPKTATTRSRSPSPSKSAGSTSQTRPRLEARTIVVVSAVGLRPEPEHAAQAFIRRHRHAEVGDDEILPPVGVEVGRLDVGRMGEVRGQDRRRPVGLVGGAGPADDLGPYRTPGCPADPGSTGSPGSRMRWRSARRAGGRRSRGGRAGGPGRCRRRSSGAA